MSSLKIITNLKSRNNNNAHALEVLPSADIYKILGGVPL
jgi:hypothetical protein